MTTEIATTATAKFDAPIDELVQAIVFGNESLYIRGEFFGYFVNRLVRSYLQTDNMNGPSFNSFNFSEPKRKIISNLTDKLASYLHRGDPIVGADHLNYVLTNTLSRTYAAFGNNNPGLLAYLRGMILYVQSDIRTVNMIVASEREKVMNLRRYVVTLGVLDAVLRGVVVLDLRKTVDSSTQHLDSDSHRIHPGSPDN